MKHCISCLIYMYYINDCTCILIEYGSPFYFPEFRMSYQSDSVRKMQLLALLTEKGHPFGKFLWGKLDSRRGHQVFLQTGH